MVGRERGWRIWAVAALVGCASAPHEPRTPALDASTAEVPVADALRRDLMVFASDSFRGRETGTPDERRAARFLIARLTALGVRPAGDSGFCQRVPLVRETLGPLTSMVVTSGHGATAHATAVDLVPLLDLGGGVPPPKQHADADLVFAGYGTADELSRVTVRDRVVVIVNGAPPGSAAADRARLESEAAISDRIQRVLAREPAAVILLLAGASEGVYRAMRAENGRSLSVAGVLDNGPDHAAPGAPDGGLPDADRPVPMLLIGTPRAGSPLLPAGWPGEIHPQPLTGRRFTGRVAPAHEAVRSCNVVAVVPGHDPSLRGSYVAFGAHYDHIGIQAPEHGDSVANGADDDGSGSVALLALARAFEAGPPLRRSVLLVWHVGEEKGLLGSAWFTDHPTVSIDSIVAQVNADMIGRNGPDSLFVVGPRAAPHGQSRALGAVVDSVNAALPTPFILDRQWDSPTHPEQIYYRSDHYNYARKGIPVVFFTSGLHADYHRVTDSPDRIDYDKLAHVVGLLRALGIALANRDTRPR
jgi:hypothetical protein